MALISTIYGPMEEKLLTKKISVYENGNEICEWVDYWFEGMLVHHSVNLKLKKGLKVGFTIYQE